MFSLLQGSEPFNFGLHGVSQGAKGGVWNGGGWNRQILGPEVYFSGPEISSKIPFCWIEGEAPRNFWP